MNHITYLPIRYVGWALAQPIQMLGKGPAYITSLLLLWLCTTQVFGQNVVNVYVWGGVIPKTIVRNFEKETGIKVNFSTYDSNEIMYAKLHASRQSIYDVILPSSYFVERMHKQGMLTKLNKHRLPNMAHLLSRFANPDYDPDNQYSVPLIWGATGIYYNANWVKSTPATWKQLFDKQWDRQLLVLDDAREVFSIGLMSLGYQPNDTDPNHLQQAYQKLLTLIPNIKLFASDSVQAIVIDEDANVGSVWNGDAYKAQAENRAIQFIYPQDGFVIWVDCLAIPKNAPHLQEAYQFINYMLKPSSAALMARSEGHAITNATGITLLPPSLQNNTVVYPSEDTLKHGFIQRDIGERALELLNHYWEQFKLAF